MHDALRSPGQPLDPATRALFEPRFEHDFSHVRVHTGATAAASARAVNALAYTVGSDVVFGQGQYAPQARKGLELIAHELAHTIQQAQPITRPPHPTGLLQRKVSPDLPTIQDKLRKGLSEGDVHQVIGIFQGMSDGDLRDTVRALDTQDLGYVERFLLNVSDADAKTHFETLRRVKNARVRRIVTTTGTTTVTTEVVGSCAPDQFQQIYQAAITAMSWLDKAVARIDAYMAASGDARNKEVKDALTVHFHTTAADVVKHVRERLAHIRADIQSAPQFEIECHGVWDKECDTAAAYVFGRRNVVVFCNSFFGFDPNKKVEAVIHEMAHAQVGGKPITDRGYESDRILPLLSTEEALTNAESYGLITEQLATGAVPRLKAPQDTREDCPDAWWRLLQRAIAVAQRWNRNAQVTFSTLTPAQAQVWPKKSQALLGGTGQADIDRAKKAYNRTADKLGSSIDFECEPEGGGRCDDAEIYWYAFGHLHICPSWRALSTEEARIESLLAGLFGYIGDVGDSTRMSQYAALAREISSGWGRPPERAEILGGSRWTPDIIGIDVEPVEPKAPQFMYGEDGTSHERMSRDQPMYQVTPPAPFSSIPNFRIKVRFLVDTAGPHARPLPFTPPQVRVLFQWQLFGKPFTRTESDLRPVYLSDGQSLQTTFPEQFDLFFDQSAPLHMHFELKDPDANVTRVYDDTIQIQVTAQPGTTRP